VIEPYIATFSGGKYYPMGPCQERLNIVDIAHALARICRYNGQVTKFWSVAAHSVEIARRAGEAGFSAPYIATALMHDASEAYLMDVPKPIKPLFLNYKEWESNLEYVIAQHYGLVFPHPQEVKQLDQEILLDEIYAFHQPGSAAWERWGLSHESSPDRPVLTPLAPAVGEREFLLAAREVVPLFLREAERLEVRIQQLNADIREGDVL
jgi:hypothetical protein